MKVLIRGVLLDLEKSEEIELDTHHDRIHFKVHEILHFGGNLS